MKKHWSQIAKLPILINGENKDLGRINGVFIHPDNGQIIAFLVGLFTVLVPVDVRKWTTKGVKITESEALLPPTEIHRLREVGFRKAFLNGKQVRSKSGYRYGIVKDFEMDFQTNYLLNFEVSKNFLCFEWKKRIFRVQDIDHITESKIIVTLEPEQTVKVELKRPHPVG